MTTMTMATEQGRNQTGRLNLVLAFQRRTVGGSIETLLWLRSVPSCNRFGEIPVKAATLSRDVKLLFQSTIETVLLSISFSPVSRQSCTSTGDT